jgi:3-isopropylmalate dehydrogenase
VLDEGIRTPDIMSAGMTEVGTNGMGTAVLAEFGILMGEGQD